MKMLIQVSLLKVGTQIPWMNILIRIIIRKMKKEKTKLNHNERHRNTQNNNSNNNCHKLKALETSIKTRQVNTPNNIINIS